MAASVVYTTIDGMILHENRGGTERDYMPDPLGSTAALLDDSQTMTDTWSYWPYGEVASRTGSNPTPFTFVGILGYFKDVLDKLLYVRARFLQPSYGSWLTQDLISTPFTSFDYGLDDPVSHTDRLGLQPNTSKPDPHLESACLYLYCSMRLAKEKYQDVVTVGGGGKGAANKIIDRFCKSNDNAIEDCVKKIQNAETITDLMIKLFCKAFNVTSSFTCGCVFAPLIVIGRATLKDCIDCCNKHVRGYGNSICQEWCENAQDADTYPSHCGGRPLPVPL